MSQLSPQQVVDILATLKQAGSVIESAVWVKAAVEIPHRSVGGGDKWYHAGAHRWECNTWGVASGRPKLHVTSTFVSAASSC